jgi:hypothetical protein
VLEFLQQARSAQPSLRFQELAQLVKERFGVLVHPRAFVNLIWPLLMLSFGPTWPLFRLHSQTPLLDCLP